MPSGGTRKEGPMATVWAEDAERVAELADYPDGGYEWDQITVVRADGRLYWIEEGGCSCNGPLENTAISDMTPLSAETFPEFERAVRDFGRNVDPEERRDFLREVRAAL